MHAQCMYQLHLNASSTWTVNVAHITRIPSPVQVMSKEQSVLRKAIFPYAQYRRNNFERTISTDLIQVYKEAVRYANTSICSCSKASFVCKSWQPSTLSGFVETGVAGVTPNTVIHTKQSTLYSLRTM